MSESATTAAVTAWIAQNVELLADAADADAAARQGLSDSERWDQIRAACRAAAAMSAHSPAAAARAADVERDHARWNRMIDALRGSC